MPQSKLKSWIRPLIFYFTTALTVSLNACKQDDTKEPVEIVPKWYSNSIIYNLDVDSYQDSNADGTGDFNGLISRLPYLASLGVDVIWLSPFQPSPDMDDGYDVSDYYSIDKRLGSMADFERFMAAAKSHKIKIVMDMVLNHTSIEHPWFKASRSDSTGKFRSRYSWSSKKPKDFDKGMAFEGVQTETWTYDEIAKKYYFHRFYNFQPDLNYQNKEVQREAVKILQFWSAKGIKGFRLDAVPFIIDVPESGAENPQHMFGVLDSLVNAVKSIDPDALLLGEANVEPTENEDYFGAKGQRLSMMFNFYANQYLFYALADENPAHFAKALMDTKEKPADSQWAFFLRNHDEIDLGRLNKMQRNKVYSKFGPENNMQLYDRGIRRRLAPMLSNPAKLKMAYSLLYSLPGTPVIRSGEEIGMGDDLTLPERLSVRTPMQWNTSPNAGFSTSKHTFRPVISMGNYSYNTINVETEEGEKSSLLNHIKKLISLRKKCPEIGTANWQILDCRNNAILAISYQNGLIAIHNFTAKKQQFALNLQKQAINLLSPTNSTLNTEHLNLEPYGALWLKLKE